LAQMSDLSYAGIEDPKPLGCWKDDIPRALPTLEGNSAILSEHYTVRTNPIEKCHAAAAEQGSTIFAVQDGGQCFGADKKSNYKKHGASTACSSDGKGGPMANNVYEISPLKKCLCTKPGEHSKALPAGKKCFGSVTETNAKKRTALHVSARYGHHKCTKVLIGAKANVEALDFQKKTPLALAQWKSATLKCGSVKALVAAKAKTDGLNPTEKGRVQKCVQAS